LLIGLPRYQIPDLRSQIPDRRDYLGSGNQEADAN